MIHTAETEFIDRYWSILIKALSNRSAFINVIGCLSALTNIEKNYLSFSYMLDDEHVLAVALLLNIKNSISRWSETVERNRVIYTLLLALPNTQTKSHLGKVWELWQLAKQRSGQRQVSSPILFSFNMSIEVIIY